MISRSSIWIDGREFWESSGREPGEKPVRIWLVDDNEEFRGLLAELLECEKDFSCTRQFGSGNLALAALLHEPAPDVVLLDLNLGDECGLDFIRPFKTLAASTRVIMLTTFFDSSTKSWALAEGASEFLLKSYSLQEISGRIRHAVNRASRFPVADGAPLPDRISGRDHPQPSWPNRRAPELNNGRTTHGHDSSAHPDEGRRKAPLGASGRLARGVRFFQALLS